MSEQIQVQPITVEQVQALEEQGILREIRDGQWAELTEDGGMASKRHGKTGARIIAQLAPYVYEHKLGEVYQDQTVYVLEQEGNKITLMVIPDISFVIAAHVVEEDPDDYYYQAPDLAIEVTSKNDKAPVIQEKINDYLTHGTKQVWQVYPQTKQIVVHLPDGTAKTYSEKDILPCGDLLSGFTLDVSKVFET
jgi:Uma2 family endonuclease